MDKRIYNQAAERANGVCEVKGCQSSNGLELHHIIYGSGKRTQCERIESVIFLCNSHHRGSYGIHGMYGHSLNIKLKKQLQGTYFNNGMSEEDVRYFMGGKLY